MENENKNNQNWKSSIAFWIAIVRGILAIALGLILIFNPEKSRFFLFNMMGLFWLVNGIILLRGTHPVFKKQEDRVLGKRMALVLGVVAILAGLLVISRTFSRQVLPEGLVVQVLGVVILLTGILHLIGEYRIGRFIKGKRTTAHKFLAVFEIVLGVMLVYSPLDLRPVVYWIATAWALIGGGLIIADAIFQARKNKSVQNEKEPQEMSGS